MADTCFIDDRTLIPPKRNGIQPLNNVPCITDPKPWIFPHLFLPYLGNTWTDLSKSGICLSHTFILIYQSQRTAENGLLHVANFGPYFTLLSANSIKTTPTPAIHSLWITKLTKLPKHPQITPFPLLIHPYSTQYINPNIPAIISVFFRIFIVHHPIPIHLFIYPSPRAHT